MQKSHFGEVFAFLGPTPSRGITDTILGSSVVAWLVQPS